jgi:uncharacterized protein YgfB (UPF0149 family)
MTLPGYPQILEQLQQHQLPYLPSELQGVVCGALAVTPAPSEGAVLALLANHVGEERWPAALVGNWRVLRQQVLEAYQGDDLALTLLLPESGVDRIEALATWCEGFLAGFAETGLLAERAGAVSHGLPALVNEALGDLMAIGQMNVPEEMSELERTQLAEIEEHCRMAAFTVFTEMALQSPERKVGK